MALTSGLFFCFIFKEQALNDSTWVVGFHLKNLNL